MNKDQLLARSKELQIKVPEGATNKEISDLIKIAEHTQLQASLKEATDASEAITKERNHAKAELEAANATIAELNAKLETDTATSEKKKGVTYKTENKTFEFGVKNFRFKGEKYEALEAVKNPTLMEELIEAKFNHLKQV